MASPVRVHINHATAARLLRTRFAAQTNALAHAIAEQIGEDAFVHEYTTDRSAAAVLVPTPVQAREGALTRAAAALGLEVKAKP
jgi:hypothetical protein